MKPQQNWWPLSQEDETIGLLQAVWDQAGRTQDSMHVDRDAEDEDEGLNDHAAEVLSAASNDPRAGDVRDPLDVVGKLREDDTANLPKPLVLAPPPATKPLAIGPPPMPKARIAPPQA